MTEKPFAPACERNWQPILEILTTYLMPDSSGTLLEVGSGTGQHAVYLAPLLPSWQWLPSDLPSQLAGIEQWRQSSTAENILAPQELDLSASWPDVSVDVVFTANTLHIISEALVENFVSGAASSLEEGGLLMIYGPFKYSGEFTSDSNAQFEQWLKNRDPLSGVRDFETVNALCHEQGLSLLADHKMPANNQMLIFKRVSST